MHWQVPPHSATDTGPTLVWSWVTSPKGDRGLRQYRTRQQARMMTSHVRPNPSNGSVPMLKIGQNPIAAMLLATGLLGSTCIPAAAVSMDGRVQAGGGAVAGSTVTLWAASASEP